jgi:hypothetical protein
VDVEKDVFLFNGNNETYIKKKNKINIKKQDILLKLLIYINNINIIMVVLWMMMVFIKIVVYLIVVYLRIYIIRKENMN